MIGKTTYLADGVYAEFDGFQIILKTQRFDSFGLITWHYIALDGTVLFALDAYREHLKRLHSTKDEQSCNSEEL